MTGSLVENELEKMWNKVAIA